MASRKPDARAMTPISDVVVLDELSGTAFNHFASIPKLFKIALDEFSLTQCLEMHSDL